MEWFNTPARRFYALIALAVIGIGGATFAFLYFTGDKGETVKSDVVFSSQEQGVIESQTKAFLQAATTWGLKQDSINENNALTVRSMLNSNHSDAKNFFNGRGDTYLEVRSKFIAYDSNLWASDGTVLTWHDAHSRSTMSRFEFIDATVTVPSNGSLITIGDNAYRAVQVDAVFNVKQTRMLQMIDDSSWDGELQVDEKTFESNAVIVLVEMEGAWKIYDVRGETYPFLLVSWSNGNSDYLEYQGDFTVVGNFKAVLDESIYDDVPEGDLIDDDVVESEE